MRIVVALGGNALLRRGEPMTADNQRSNIRTATEQIARIHAGNQLVIAHGNGPQVGVLALQSASDPHLTTPYPFDVLGAQTQGMIGYWLLQAMQNALPGRQVAAIINQTLVEVNDPAFDNPTKFVGEVYDEVEARRLAEARGGTPELVFLDGADFMAGADDAVEPRAEVRAQVRGEGVEVHRLVAAEGGDLVELPVLPEHPDRPVLDADRDHPRLLQPVAQVSRPLPVPFVDDLDVGARHQHGRFRICIECGRETAPRLAPTQATIDSAVRLATGKRVNRPSDDPAAFITGTTACEQKKVP